MGRGGGGGGVVREKKKKKCKRERTKGALIFPLTSIPSPFANPPLTPCNWMPAVRASVK